MRKLYTYPWLIVAIIAVITIFFGFQLPRAELDNNNLRFVPNDDPALETSRWIDGMFGSSFFILVGLERRYGTVFDSAFLDRLREYTQALEDIPIVRDVTSLINAEYITASGDAIIVEKLVGTGFSGTPAEIAELKRRLLSWNMYERALYSDDFTATQILIPLTIASDEASSPEITEYIMRVRDLAHETFAGYAAVYVTGMPVISSTVSEAMNADLTLLVPVVTLLVLLVLFFSFRRFTPVVLPLLTVVVSVIWAVGAMPLFGIKLSVITTVLPVILVAIGNAYGIHVLTHYLAAVQKQQAGGNSLSVEEHRELVLAVMMKMRKPVFLTAITTFAGFCSFCFTKVAPVREYGYFASFGVLVAFSVTMTLIPALLLMRGPRLKPGKPQNKSTALEVVLADNLMIIAQRKKTILFCAVLVIAFSLYGVSKLIVDNVMVEYFRTDTDIYRSDNFIRRQFGGSKVISVVADADTEVLLHPDTLAAMDGLSVFLQEKVPGVGKVMGFTDLVKRINQVFNVGESPDGLRITTASASTASTDDFGFGGFGFGFDDFGFDDFVEAEQGGGAGDHVGDRVGNYVDAVYTINELLALFDRAGNHFRGMNANDLIWELKRQVNYEGASYYEIPVDPQRYGKETSAELQRLIANYLVLLSGNIGDYANDPLEPTAIKATVQLRTLGMDDSHAIFREIEQYVAANFPPGVNVTLGGTTMVESSLNDLVIQSQIISMVFSVLSIFIIIAIAHKSLMGGLLAMTPLSISILLNFAIMGLAGIKLNLGTSMVGAVSVCVGVDYTIHCLEAYKREYKIAGGTDDFLRRVFFSSGKAIIVNAVSVGAGFAVLLLSRFVMLADFGLLIACTMISSALVSLTVLPALLALIKPKFVIHSN
ncbi:MAG: MMPL family transporter [Treponema sp.]|nr:MMPL family transporter [Treponema sp.]